MGKVIVALMMLGAVLTFAPLSAEEVSQNQCNVVPGDADSSGALNLADMVYLINYVYNKPRPSCYVGCWDPNPYCRMDVNASGTVLLHDFILLFRYMFDRDNPFTFCHGSDSGNCWTPVPSGTCCLPASLYTSYSNGQDPGLPDEITITADGPAVAPPGGGDIILRVWLKTDNTGAGNDIIGFSIPMKIRSSNPTVGVYLVDTTVAFTFGSTSLESWIGEWSVNSDSNLISIGVMTVGSGLSSGTHLIANLKVHATDSTTLSFGFWPYPDNPYLAVVTSLGEEYSPCAYKAGDLDQDGRVNIVDVVYLANIVLKSWANPGLPCLADANGNTNVSLADVMYLAKHVFKHGLGPVTGGGCCL